MALKQFQDTSKANAIIKLQNAFRNKKAIDLFSSRYADKVLQEKKIMNTANDVISQINKERQIANVNDLTAKLNATLIANDMTNNLFANSLNQIPQNNYNLRPKKSTTIKQVEKSLKAVKKKIKK
jgi:formylmethanofuran dehydrogenase subunit A